MITYELNWAIRNRAFDHGMLRSGSMGHHDTLNSKNWMKGKPPWWRHYAGRVGEEVVSLHTGWPLDWTTIGRGDDGSDFPHGIQVKTRESKIIIPDLLIAKSQYHRKPCRFYILVWCQEPHIPKAHIVGWIKRENFERLHYIDDLGNGTTMILPHSFLHPIDDFPIPFPSGKNKKAA